MEAMGFIQSESSEVTTSSILVPQTFTHSIAFGQTGSGKTTGYIYPNLQERIKEGHGILLYDYKGKEHLSVKYFAQQIGRLNDVVEIGKPWGSYINIIEQMGEEDLEKFFDNILQHSDDQQYWHSSAKSLGQSLLKILKALDAFATAVTKVDQIFEKNTIKAGSFYYPATATLESLVKVCLTFSKLGKFIDNLDNLLAETYTILQSSMRRDIMNHKDIDALKPNYKEAVEARERLIEVVKETSDSLESFGKDANENLSQNIIGSLISPLLTLSQNRFFNENTFNINTALNEGKIVIINTEALSDEALESLNNVIMHEFTGRTRSIGVNPISVFIDEAQRVLSENTDLPIDVLREAKVDIFLAVQNSALLKNKLTEEHFDALMGNLTNQFHFKNGDLEVIDSQHILSSMSEFEYLNSSLDFKKINTCKPLHISLKHKLQVEHHFQKYRGILSKYSYSNRQKQIVLEYEPRRFKNSELLAIDINTHKESVIRIENKKNLEHIEKEVNFLIQSTIKELNEDYSHEFEYEYSDDNLLETAC